VAPVNKTVSYGTVATALGGTGTKCWITQNLGADHSATNVNDATEASGGWYWQFNRTQGFKIADDGITRTPNTGWINPISETSDWTAANDPCTLLLGTGWRIPTSYEWTIAGNNGALGSTALSYSSVLKLHGAGYFWYYNGAWTLMSRGTNLSTWAPSQADITNATEMSDQGWHNPQPFQAAKASGLPVRCLKD